MPRLPRLSVLLPLAALLAGCSTASHVTSLASQTATSGLHGSLHGGQQPIVGATIQLYAVGTTGDGSASTPLLTPAILTDATGSFDLTNKFTCPQTTTLVYIVATGGNPGLPPPFNNPASTLISALGPCGNPNNINFISLNEVSTVAAVYALAPFMSSPTAIGSGASDAQALADAFTLAMELVNPVTGTSPGASVPPGTIIPVAQINTLANLISACVNSAGGTAGDSSICGQIFSLTQGTGTAPTDTTTALLHLALNPGLNTQALYDLVLPTAPFQPTITQQPPDFGVRPTVPSDFTVSPSSLSFGSIFVGGTTAYQTVTLANNTAHAYSLNGFTFSGANPADFVTVTVPGQPTNCSNPIVPGASCTFGFAFRPTAAGARQAYVSFNNTSPNPVISISLSGVGTAGTAGPVTVSPSSLTISEYNTPQTVTLTNLGNMALAVSGIHFHRVQYAPGDGYTQTNNCGTSLQPQSICTINVSFHDNSGNSDAMIIEDDAAAGPQSVSLINGGNAFYVPDSLNFGRTSVGGASTLPLTIGTGGSGGNFDATIVGPNASDFSFDASTLTHDVPCSSDFRVSCNLEITFKPSDVGTRTATIHLDGIGNIPITGTAVGAGPYFWIEGTLDPPLVTPLNFGTYLGAPSTMTFNVHHTGTTFTAIPPLVVTGPHASEFSGTSNCIANQADCQINLTYTPSTPEVFTANATVTEASSTLQQAFQISVNTGTWLSVSPSQLNFPATLAGTLSAPQSLTATSVSNNPVNMTVSGAFQITSGTSCTATPCQISVVYAPSAAASPGTLTGSLFITDPISGAHAAVYLIGTTTVQTTASVSPGSLTFPTRAINSTSIPQTITVTNTGSTNVLTFTSVSLTGANPGDYILTNNCTSNVVPGNSCTINVSFAPTASGTRAANVSIVSNSTTSPDVVTLSGTGSTPP